MERSLGWKVNEFLLVLIIIFQILDFFKVLDPFWDYVKKIISWALIGYLLYLVSPSGIFFGKKREWWDAAVIMGYFAMTVKNLVSFAGAARDHMLAEVLTYATFVPTPQTLEGVAKIPLQEGVFNAFKYGVGVIPNSTLLAKPFATQLTLTQQAIPFTITTANESATALLQPIGHNGMILQLYNTLAANAATIERFGFIIGALLLIILGIYAALRYNVEEKSVLTVIHEGGPVKDLGHTLLRTISVLFIMAAFFVLLFNLVVEWLAIAIDAPLAMSGIAVYLLLAIRFHKQTHHHLDEGEVLSKTANFGVNFLKEFSKLFTERRTVLIGLSGLLVLHLVVDIGTFVIPYLTGLQDPLYFGQLGAGHQSIPALVQTAWSGSWLYDINLILLYLFNAAGILALLALPAYIWYKTFRLRTRPSHEKEEEYHPSLPGWLLGLCISGIAAFLLLPAFTIRRLASGSLIGVDLQTQAIAGSLTLLAILIAAFIIIWAASLFHTMKKWLMALLFIASMIFFAKYIYTYFMATVGYYIQEGFLLFQSARPSDLFLGLAFFLFLIINLLFYTFGFLSYVYETGRD